MLFLAMKTKKKKNLYVVEMTSILFFTVGVFES